MTNRTLMPRFRFMHGFMHWPALHPISHQKEYGGGGGGGGGGAVQIRICVSGAALIFIHFSADDFLGVRY